MTVTDPSGNVVAGVTTALVNTGTSSNGAGTLTTTLPALALETTLYTYTIATTVKSGRRALS